MAQPRDDKINTAELERYIGEVNFPATKITILGQAQRKHAPQEVIDYIQNSPNRTYHNIFDLTAGAPPG